MQIHTALTGNLLSTFIVNGSRKSYEFHKDQKQYMLIHYYMLLCAFQVHCCPGSSTVLVTLLPLPFSLTPHYLMLLNSGLSSRIQHCHISTSDTAVIITFLQLLNASQQCTVPQTFGVWVSHLAVIISANHHQGGVEVFFSDFTVLTLLCSIHAVVWQHFINIQVNVGGILGIGQHGVKGSSELGE